jgi:hypothetical protein
MILCDSPACNLRMVSLGAQIAGGAHVSATTAQQMVSTGNVQRRRSNELSLTAGHQTGADLGQWLA